MPTARAIGNPARARAPHHRPDRLRRRVPRRPDLRHRAGYDWLTIGRMATLMGALKVEHPGTQNQRFTYDEFAEAFRQQFDYAL